MSLEFAVLGAVEVRRDGQRLPQGGAKERALLCLLLLRANQTLPVERIAHDLWEGNPPEQAAAAVRVYVSHLRKILGDEAIETRAPGYSLPVEPTAVDAGRFQAAAHEARSALAQGDAATAAVRFRDALAMWRGAAYADVADLEFARGEATRLEEARLAALEGRVEADLACGRHRELVGELEALVTQHPLRERFWAQRMLALYRSGRQAEALRAYRELRELLVDELGIEPSPELAAMEAAVLAQDPSLLVAPPTPGTAISARALRAAATASTVIVLYTDIVDATFPVERLGDEETESRRRTHFALLRQAVSNYHGEEVRNLGHGLMTAFASAAEAIGAAVAIQQAAARHNRRHPERTIGVRVGLHVSEQIKDEADRFGLPVVVAERLCDLAAGGQILASGLAGELVAGRSSFSLAEPRPVQVNGVEAPVLASEVSWSQAPAVPFPLPPALAGVPGRFVGRTQELASLAAAWDRADSGKREVVLVSGEPGIGKTALVGHAARAAHANGAIVLFGHCDEESLLPFQPFVEALAHYVDLCPLEELRVQVGHRAPDLALLLPELRRRLPDLPEASGFGPETERYRLFEAVPAFISAIATQAPVVMVFDDLHWADRPTLQLLLHTLRRTPQTALLVLGSYRDTDLVRTHPMAETLVELRRADLVARLPLRGLGRNDVVVLLNGGAESSAADRALADALWAETEGSPLFLREILRHLTETDAVECDAGGAYRARRRIRDLGIPEGVKEVIGRRFTRLAEETNAVLKTASVLGREFRADVVGQVMAVTLDAVLDALDEGAAAGVIAEVPGVVGRYAFTHALVRETLYEELSLTRRVRMHQRAGEAIEAISAADIEPHLSELAFHFSQAAVAGDAAKAVDYATRAGERAMALVAYEEAARHFAMALEVVEDSALSDERAADLLLAAGHAQWRARDHTVARTSFERAATIARALGDADRLARAALGYAGAYVSWIWVEGFRVNQPVIARLEEALAALPDGDGELRARVLAALAAELHFVPDDDRCDLLSAQAVAMARRLQDAATLGYVLAARNLATLGPDTAHERLANADEALALAEQLDDHNLAAFGYGHRAIALFELDDVDGARLADQRAFELAQHTHDPVTLELTLHGLGALSQLEGRFGEAERRHLDAFQAGQEARDPNVFFAALGGLWSMRRLQGRFEEVFGSLEAGSSYLEPLSLGGHALDRLLALGRALIGDRVRCRKYLNPTDPREWAPGALRLFWMCILAESCAFVGDEARAAALYDLLLPYAERNAAVGLVIVWGSVSEFLGMLAATLRRFDDAARHFDYAISRYRANRWLPLLAHAQAEYAAALAASGDSDPAVVESLAHEALATAHTLDLRGVKRRAADALADARGQPSTSTPTRPSRVTRRDQTRAKLSAAGRRAIARMARETGDDDLSRRFRNPLAQRAMFSAMARAFQPAMAFGFEGHIGIELRATGDDGDLLPSDWWTLDVQGKKALARRGRSENPAVILHIDIPDFIRMASGDPPITAISEGRVQITGDLFVLVRIGDMFGAIEPFEVLSEAETQNHN